MRTLVTGGAGFIGSHLAERLRVNGGEVVVVDNLSAGAARVGVLERLGIELEKLDVREKRVRSVIESFRPQIIYHLAAQIDVRRSVADPAHDADVNVVGTLKVLEAARSVGARIVFPSSGGTIYGEPDDSLLPVSEEVSGRPSSPYGIGKRVMEDYLRFYESAWKTRFVSLALGNVYGPRQDPHGEAGVVAIFGLRLLRGEQCVIYGDGGQTRDFVYVGDVVDAFAAAGRRGDGETINIGTGIETSVLDLYWEMAEICGLRSDPHHEEERAGELRRSCLDISKAKNVLGWEPGTPLTEGLRRTIESLT